MHSTSVIPLAQVSNSFFRKKKFQKKKKLPRIDPTTMLKENEDGCFDNTRVNLGKGRWIKSVSQKSLDIARA